MSNLFRVKTPEPDPKLAEMQQKQEARLEAEEMEKRRLLSARQRARRTGGQRMLLSTEREAPQKGLGPYDPTKQSTLG